METVKKPWYKTGWGVILTNLFFPILGTYLIWAKSGWKTWVKIISTLGIISIVVASNSQENEPTSTATTKTSTSSKKDYKYEILDLEGDIYKNVLVILVDDKISTEDLKETLKLAAKENIKDKDKIYVQSYGDKRFYDSGRGVTHGILGISKNGDILQEDYRAKKEIPTDEEKDIYTSYLTDLEESSKKSPDETSSEREKREDEISKSFSKKRNITTEKLKEIFFKVTAYVVY